MTTTEPTTRIDNWIGHETDLAELVAGARAGCASRREIVDRFDDQLRYPARARGFDAPTAADVVQQTQLAAVANIGALREAHAFAGHEVNGPDAA